jgi:hypothetical protein
VDNRHIHHCQRTDDLEAELAVARNLLWFSPFLLDRVPPFRASRARELRLMQAQINRARQRQERRDLADLIPAQRSLSAEEAEEQLLRRNSRGGRA